MIRIQISGGLGDILALTPVLKALKQQNPARSIEVFFISDTHLQLLQHNPNIDKVRRVNRRTKKIRHVFASKIQDLFRDKIRRLRFPGIWNLSVGALGTYSAYRMNMAHILAQPFGLELSEIQPEIYLTDAENSFGKAVASAYRCPVIINPVNRSRKYHTWPLARWQNLIKSHSQNDFLQLGLHDEPLVEGAIDLRGDLNQNICDSFIQQKLSENGLKTYGLREMIAILKHAHAYCGMDTFWQHAAAGVNTVGVVLHGDGHPAVFGHDIHINLYKNLRCGPCLPNGLSNTNPHCPYDAECITSIGVDEVSQALAQQLG